MNQIKVFGHASYIGLTGINNHFRDFFRSLSNNCDVKIRNFTVGATWKGLNDDPHKDEPYINDLDKKLINVQSLWCADGSLGKFPVYQKRPYEEPVDVHVIADIVDHHYFFEKFNGPKIAYTVWESTLLPPRFFEQMKSYDEIWAASEWQKECMVAQGLKKDKIQIVPAGVDTKTFFPEDVNFDQYYSDGRFKFVVFGRWSHRKATTEIIKTFVKTFRKDEPVDLVLSVDNPFPEDDYKSTEERLKVNEISDERIKILHFPSRQDYIKFMKKGHVFLSCSRGEGWNLPLIEAMACGTPAIYSDCTAQIDFAKDKAHGVRIAGEVPNTMPNSGNYYEPDWNHLSEILRDVYVNYKKYKEKALVDSIEIRKKYDWEAVGRLGYEKIQNFLEKRKVPKKKKVLFITPHLSTGGMPQYLEKKIKMMMEEFDVYCVEYNQIATFYVVQRNRIVDLLKEKFYRLQDLPKENLLDIIYDIEPDIVHLEDFPEHFMSKDISKKLYSSDRRYTIFETCHGIYFNPADKRFFPDKYLFVCQHQADMCKDHGVPYEIVEYPVENLIPNKKKYREELNFSDDYKHVINVGLFTKGKNQGELIEYARSLQNEKIKFHFIGNQAGNFEDYWKPLMNDLPPNCLIWGERNDVEKFYQAADLMVFTSIMETAPIVIKESISWKLPCLIHNLPTYKGMYDKYEKVKYLVPNNPQENINLIKTHLNLQ
jgi:glycosyltransferase involved in cell wall biosynthesis